MKLLSSERRVWAYTCFAIIRQGSFFTQCILYKVLFKLHKRIKSQNGKNTQLNSTLCESAEDSLVNSNQVVLTDETSILIMYTSMLQAVNILVKIQQVIIVENCYRWPFTPSKSSPVCILHHWQCVLTWVTGDRGYTWTWLTQMERDPRPPEGIRVCHDCQVMQLKNSQRRT